MSESVIYQIWIIYVQSEEIDNIRKEINLEKCKHSCYHETKIRLVLNLTQMEKKTIVRLN